METHTYEKIYKIHMFQFLNLIFVNGYFSLILNWYYFI